MILFPTGTLAWAGRWTWPVRVLLVASVAGAAALLGVSTSEYPHTLSFVLFFGLLTPIAGVTAQLARYRRATGAEARQQSRILLWALGLAFAAALVLTVITLTTQGLHLPGRPRSTASPGPCRARTATCSALAGSVPAHRPPCSGSSVPSSP